MPHLCGINWKCTIYADETNTLKLVLLYLIEVSEHVNRTIRKIETY